MSGAVRWVKKTFKKVVNVVKKVFNILKPVIMVAAIYFTAGVAIGAFGGASFVSALPGFGSQGIFANMASSLGSWTGFAGGEAIQAAGAGLSAGAGAQAGLGAPVTDLGTQAAVTQGGATASPAASAGAVPAGTSSGGIGITAAPVGAPPPSPTLAYGAAPPLEVSGSALAGAPPSQFAGAQTAQLSGVPAAAVPPPPVAAPLQGAQASSLQAAPGSAIGGGSATPLTDAAVSSIPGDLAAAPQFGVQAAAGNGVGALPSTLPTAEAGLGQRAWEGVKTVGNAIVDNPVTRGLSTAMDKHSALTMVAATGVAKAYEAKVKSEQIKDERAYEARLGRFGLAENGDYRDLSKIITPYLPPASRIDPRIRDVHVTSMQGQPLINSVRGGVSEGVPQVQQQSISAPTVPQVAVSQPQLLDADRNDDIRYPRG